MKNLMIATALMFFGSIMQAKAVDGSEKNPNKKETVLKSKTRSIGIGLSITFGRGPNCDRKGVCAVKLDLDLNPGNRGSYHEGSLTLQIPTDYIKNTQPEKLQNFQGQNKFIVEEDYVLPKEVCNKLGTSERLIIHAGSYPMSLRDNVYTVIIGDML